MGQRAVAGVEGGDDDEGSHGQDHKGVDEDADHGDHTLVMGMLDLCHGVGVRGRAHTGLIGKQAALDALADGGLQGVAQAAADDGVGEEGILEDHAEGLRQIGQAQDEQDQPADQIQRRP